MVKTVMHIYTKLAPQAGECKDENPGGDINTD
jgi:hypothetical protein